MIFSVGIFAILGALGLGFVAFAWITEFRFEGDGRRAESIAWLRRWTIQGLIVPTLIWTIMNFGFSFELQSFMPQLQYATGTPRWWPLYAGYVGSGFCIIASYWSALTVGWIIVRSGLGLDGEMRKHYRGLCITSFLGMLLPALFLLWIAGWFGLGLAILAILAPVVGYGPTILRPKKSPPLYARAVARMKFGKYSEAEEEVIRQLERREDDFDGWMMLAELYANHFNDIDQAEHTVLEICDQPRTTPGQLSTALHKLADWHLKLRGDPEAARRALGVISNRLPGTHAARMAELRATQLPETAQEYREQHLNKPMHLPPLHDSFETPPVPPPTPHRAKELTERTAELKARLQTHPNDTAVREELARLLANHLAQPEAAIAQAETLLSLPDQLPNKRADWLGLIAVWQIEQLQNLEAGRETLRRVIHEFPGTTTANAAQRRLFHLDAEEKVKQARAAKPPPIRIRIEMGDSQPPSNG